MACASTSTSFSSSAGSSFRHTWCLRASRCATEACREIPTARSTASSWQAKCRTHSAKSRRDHSMSVRVQHAPMTQFSVVDDCLQVGGVPLTELARRVGRTPFYAYDRALITRRVELLRKHVPGAVHLHYAMKANPMPEVVAHLARLVDGLDVASAGELRVALAAGAQPSTISFAGPGKTDTELAAAVAAGIVVNL